MTAYKRLKSQPDDHRWATDKRASHLQHWADHCIMMNSQKEQEDDRCQCIVTERIAKINLIFFFFVTIDLFGLLCKLRSHTKMD